MNPSIQLQANELKIALAGLGKVISTKPGLPVLGCARLNRDEAGIITLRGTDLDSEVIYQFAGMQPGTPLSVLLPVERLRDAKSHKGTLGFASGPHGASMQFSNGVVLQLSTPPIEAWPVMPQVEQPGIPVDESFRVAFREALECASTDGTRSAINSVFLDRNDPKSHYVVGTDGRSLYSANSFTFDLKESLRIPASKFLKWNGWWEAGAAEIAVQDFKEESWIKLKAGPWTFSTRRPEINYPNWKQCVPLNEGTTRIQIAESSVERVLNALRTLPGDEAPCHTVMLHAEGRTLLLSGCDKNDNCASVPILEATVEGLPVAISLNRHYFARALNFGLTRIILTDAFSPLVFTNGGKRLVVMPVRPEGPIQPQASAAPTPAEPAQPAALTTTPPQNPPPAHAGAITETKTMNKEISPEKPQSALQQIVEHIETIKTALKNTLNELNATITLIRQAEREKKLGDREVELVRTKLRDIQSVSL